MGASVWRGWRIATQSPMSEDSLEALITRCPNCDTRFRVSEAQLQVASGQVRCGACLDVFDGVQHLLFDGEEFDPESSADVDEVLEELEQLPEEQAADEESIPSDLAALEAAFIADLREAEAEAESVIDSTAETSVYEVIAPLEIAEQAPAEEALDDKVQTDGAGDDLSEPIAESLAGIVKEPEVAAERGNADHESAAVEGAADAPATLLGVFVYESESLEESQSEKPSHPLAITLIIALLLLLGLPAQVLWFQFDAWVQDPQKRSLYSEICEVLECELPPLRDVRLIISKKSVIRIHPQRDDARIVDVLMVNNASFAQPFPLIELRATTLQGQLIAGRRFKPAEYLQGEVQPDDLMPARTPVHVSLEIQDPGERAMNFEVRFR